MDFSKIDHLMLMARTTPDFSKAYNLYELLNINVTTSQEDVLSAIERLENRIRAFNSAPQWKNFVACFFSTQSDVVDALTKYKDSYVDHSNKIDPRLIHLFSSLQVATLEIKELSQKQYEQIISNSIASGLSPHDATHHVSLWLDKNNCFLKKSSTETGEGSQSHNQENIKQKLTINCKTFYLLKRHPVPQSVVIEFENPDNLHYDIELSATVPWITVERMNFTIKSSQSISVYIDTSKAVHDIVNSRGNLSVRYRLVSEKSFSSPIIVAFSISSNEKSSSSMFSVLLLSLLVSYLFIMAFSLVPTFEGFIVALVFLSALLTVLFTKIPLLSDSLGKVKKSTYAWSVCVLLGISLLSIPSFNAKYPIHSPVPPQVTVHNKTSSTGSNGAVRKDIPDSNRKDNASEVPTQRFSLVTPEIIYDKHNKLQWKIASSSGVNWSRANDILISSNRSGPPWRIPTVNELSTLYWSGSVSSLCSDKLVTFYIDPIFKANCWSVWTSESKKTALGVYYNFRLGTSIDITRNDNCSPCPLLLLVRNYN